MIRMAGSGTTQETRYQQDMLTGQTVNQAPRNAYTCPLTHIDGLLWIVRLGTTASVSTKDSNVCPYVRIVSPILDNQLIVKVVKGMCA